MLRYFATAITLNVKRGAMQVDYATVATDSFMVNLQSILLRFAEPFMDAKYSKVRIYMLYRGLLSDEVQIDRIDPLFFAHSSRIDVKEETRIKSTSDEASNWVDENKSLGGEFFLPHKKSLHSEASSAPPPNFISDIFYLTVAMSHYGYLRTISAFEDLGKHLDDMQRQLDMINGDGSWMGVSSKLFI